MNPGCLEVIAELLGAEGCIAMEAEAEAILEAASELIEPGCDFWCDCEYARSAIQQTGPCEWDVDCFYDCTCDWTCYEIDGLPIG